MRIRLSCFLFFTGCLGVVRAHDPGLSTALVTVRGESVRVAVTFSTADLHALQPPDPVKGDWIERLIDLRVDGARLVPRTARSRAVDAGEFQFELTWTRPATGGAAELRVLRLAALPAGHRQFVTVSAESGPVPAERLLTAREPSLGFPLAAMSGSSAPAATADEEPSTFAAFLRLGVEHIWTGYDHLLFLFGLLVVCTRFRSSIAIISCFTLAHSITLALATLDLVNLPSRYTEPLIAASIVYVGVENLLRRGAEPRGRWALTFLFGLVHGFGFATVLRELGVGQGGRGLAMPLFTFNLGVELGQIAIAAVVLPIIWRLRKNEKFLRRGVPALSAVVALAGLHWLMERTIFA
ncbi:MAG: HupE/UreJ family protein [Undibacterium sp.]|nr:HupE/UreJ family protein [Opitutaceae bacterium]